jgi:hypothetical protein
MGRRPPNRDIAHQVPIVERRRTAVEMKIAGASWQTIADELGFDSKASAYNDVRRGLQKAVAELAIPLEEYRQLTLDRLEAMINALWPKVEEGDTKAIDSTLRILNQQADLLGLKAPARMELTIDAIDAAITDLTGQLVAARGEADPPD